MSIYASVEDQKDQRFMLQAAPFETVAMLLEKAVKRFNRTLGPGKEQDLQETCILKVIPGWFIVICTTRMRIIIVNTAIR